MPVQYSVRALWILHLYCLTGVVFTYYILVGDANSKTTCIYNPDVQGSCSDECVQVVPVGTVDRTDPSVIMTAYVDGS